MVKSVSRGTARQTREAPKKPVVQRAGQASLQSPSLKSQPSQNFSPVQPNATPNFSPSANMSPVNPLEGSKSLGGSTNGSQGILSPLGQKVADFAKSAGQGLARVSTPGVLSRLAQGSQETGGFTPERLGQGTSPLGDAFSINTPEQQQQTQDALKTLGAVSSAASFGSAAAGIARSVATKAAVNEIVTQSAASSFKQGNLVYQTNPATGEIIGRMAVNTKTAELANVALTKAVSSNPKYIKWGLGAAATSIIGLGYGLNGMGLWGKGETYESMSFMSKNIMKTNDPELIKEYNTLLSELRNDHKSIAVKLLVPFMGTKDVTRKVEALDLSLRVQDAMTKDYMSVAQNFSSVNGPIKFNPNEFDPNVLIEMTKERQRIIEESFAKTTADGIAARMEYDKLKRADELAGQQASADLWLKHKKESLRLEEESMKKSAEFWLAYRKQIMKMQEDNAPSALSFGLLRS